MKKITLLKIISGFTDDDHEQLIKREVESYFVDFKSISAESCQLKTTESIFNGSHELLAFPFNTNRLHIVIDGILKISIDPIVIQPIEVFVSEDLFEKAKLISIEHNNRIITSFENHFQLMKEQNSKEVLDFNHLLISYFNEN